MPVNWMNFELALVWMLWLGWAAYWIVAARQTAANRRTESWLTGASYRVPLAVENVLHDGSKHPGHKLFRAESVRLRT
jgi:hypothetical protein